MYLGLFGLNEPPFRITPHTDFFFDGANRGATLEALLYAITHDEGIVKVTGEVGSGKTMLCRVLMERLPESVETIYLANPSLTREEILYAIADELRLRLESDRSARLLKELQDQLIALFAGGKRVVVLIDEAHAMPKETLEEIRLLSNLESGQHKLLQIVLFGQPELNELLGMPDMRQLKERITHSFLLEPLVTGDIDSYIDFRMRAAGYRGPKVFSPRAVRMISASSEGLTRRINILADKALLAAFAAGTHAVTHKEARAAIRDSDFYRPKRSRHRTWLVGATLAAGVVLGAIAGQVLRLGGAQSPAPQAARAAAATIGVAAPAAATATPSSAPAGAAPAASAVPSSATPAESSTPSTAPVVAAASAAGASTPAQSPSHAEPASATPMAASTQGAPAATGKPAAPTTAGSTSTSSTASGTVATATPIALRAPPAAQSTAMAAASPPMSSRPVAAATSTEAGPAVPDGPLSAQVFEATQQWFKSGPADGYSVQLLTVRASEIAKMERFLKRATNDVPLSDLHLYSVKIDGVQNYRAAYGFYPGQQETVNAIRDLPKFLASQAPFSRSLARMRSQNRQ